MWYDAMKRAQPILGRTFKEPDPVIYLPGSGGSITLEEFVWQDEYEIVDQNTGVKFMSSSPMLSIMRSQLTAEPDGADRVIRSGVTFRVIEDQPDGQGLIHLVLHRV